MLRKLIFSTAILLCTGIAVQGQNEIDALRYSWINPQGSARFNALGGAFTSLGGDISGASMNPAGIGIFRKSEVSLSPGVRVLGGSAGFQGQEFDMSRSNGVLPSAGLVWAGEGMGRWKGFNMGIGYTRMNSFNAEFSTSNRVDLENSLAQSFANQAQGIPDSSLFSQRPYSSGLGYLAFVINPANGSSSSYIPDTTLGSQVIQQNTYEYNGRMGETTISFAANYDDRLYLGLALGFQSVDFESITTTSEQPTLELDPTEAQLDEYRYRYTLETEGNGVNIKFGAIFRATDRLRFGGAVHTPTWYSLRDTYQATIFSTFNRTPPDNSNSDRGLETYDEQSDLSAYDYRLNSPWRFVAGGSYLFGKNGLVTLDYEYADYSNAQLKTTNANSNSGDVFGPANETTSTIYEGTHTVRGGGEYRFDKFMVRIGASYTTSPFNDTQIADAADYETLSLSGGAGYRTSTYYIDLSYTQTANTSDYFFYSGAPSHRLESREHMVTLSLGYRFGD